MRVNPFLQSKFTAAAKRGGDLPLDMKRGPLSAQKDDVLKPTPRGLKKRVLQEEALRGADTSRAIETGLEKKAGELLYKDLEEEIEHKYEDEFVQFSGGNID